MKKKIAIVFSGQIRENGLGDNIVELPNDIPVDVCHDILESYQTKFFTDEFKRDCDYDIFISTDNINIEKAFDFFGKDNVKNIHLSDTNFYLHPIETKLDSVEFYLNRLCEITDSNYTRYPCSIYQHHRTAGAYELLTAYTNIEKYDYIIRSRLDTIYEVDIMSYIKKLNTNHECHYIGFDDQFAIGRPNIMKVYFNIINNFGTYHNHHLRDNFKNSTYRIDVWKHLLIEDAVTWRYASLQLIESLFQYCDINNLDIDTTIHYSRFGFIRRHISTLRGIHSIPSPYWPRE